MPQILPALLPQIKSSQVKQHQAHAVPHVHCSVMGLHQRCIRHKRWQLFCGCDAAEHNARPNMDQVPMAALQDHPKLLLMLLALCHRFSLHLFQFKNAWNGFTQHGGWGPAGVATAFAAPIGGLLFMVEEGASFYSHSIFWRGFLSTCIGVLTLHFLVECAVQTPSSAPHHELCSTAQVLVHAQASQSLMAHLL